MNKITIKYIQNLKSATKPFATITVYDFISAKNADSVNIPLFLVGDSASMVVYGMDTTIPISVSELIFLVKAVKRGTNKALVVADMPFMSYQASIEDAVRNAGKFVKEGGAEAVKLEGGANLRTKISAIIDVGIPVIGHIGLLPQSFNQTSGYHIQGKSQKEAEKIYSDALAIQESGAFAIVLEGIPANLAKIITNELKIPTIGIGAGPHCDGQIQVFHDILGLYDKFAPKHSKQYVNLENKIQKALMKYKDEVEKKLFPESSNYITINTKESF